MPTGGFKRALGVIGQDATNRSLLDLVNSDEWRCVSDRTSDNPFELVYRAPLFVPEERDGFDYLLRFWWEFDKEGSSRLPTESEAKIIDAYTRAMRRGLTGRNCPLLLCSLSSDGMHQWIVAARDFLGAQLEVWEATGEAQIETERTCGSFPTILTTSALDESWSDVLEAQKLIERFS